MRRTLILLLSLAVLTPVVLGLLLTGRALLDRPSHPPQVTLTFDDLPVHGDLPPGESRLHIAQIILATLQREQIPPSYAFVTGAAAQNDPALLEVLQTWRAAGQPLGNHTWSHPALSASTAEQFEADIQRNEPLLQSLANTQDWHLFRYPYLDEGDTRAKRNAVHTWLHLHHYQVAQVTHDFDDYLWNPPYARCATQHDQAEIAALETSYLAAADRQITRAHLLSRALYGRDIPYVLLLHVGAFDARMLPRLIALYRSRGYTFTTLQKAQADPAYRGDPGSVIKTASSVLDHSSILRRLASMPPNPRMEKQLGGICPAQVVGH